MKMGYVIGLGLALAVPGVAIAEPADVQAAAAATAQRTRLNYILDITRKPAEVLTFLGLEKGSRAIDLFGSNFYWTEIMAPAVGPTGHVTVWEASQFVTKKTRTSFAAYQKRQPNISLIDSPFEKLRLPANAYDFAIINNNYHDLYWKDPKFGVTRTTDPDAWLKTLYAAMKPGGVVGVIDHVAKAGSRPRKVAQDLHRIDPATARADFERAGFVFEGESGLLRNPNDDHRLSVFDKAIQLRTDRFIYKFRKPR